MKKLFLASVAWYTIDKFLHFLHIDPRKSTIAFIATASNLSDRKPIEDRNKLIKLGFTIKDIDIAGKTKEKLYQETKDVDMIFVAGGNVFYLLQEARKSGFDEILRELINKGIPYVWSSAGSLLVGPSIELALDIDDQHDAQELTSYDGLSLVDFVVLPHYDDERFRPMIDANLEKFSTIQYQTIKLTDQQAVLVNGDDIEVIYE